MSAFSSTHVFGSAHNAALEELREAQIALARAWGRGEADEDGGEDGGGLESDGGKAKEDGKKDGDVESNGDDENDIVEARRRRQANERFFKRVGEGVVDVVGKLDGVSKAMEKVERESREIWRGSDSGESSSVVS